MYTKGEVVMNNMFDHKCKCSKCGADISKEAVICPSCGCQIRMLKVARADEDSPAYGILAILFGVMGGFLGLVFGLVGLKLIYKQEANRVCCKIGIGFFVVWVVLDIILIILSVAGYITLFSLFS